MEADGPPATLSEVRRELNCRVCRGDWKACRLATCPYLTDVRDLFRGESPIVSTNLFGASPPSAFVGSYGYPKVLAGPLVPPIREDTSMMDAPEQWVDQDLWDILRFRLTLVRGKASRRVIDARTPDAILRTVQEGAMSSVPVYTEMWLTKKPVIEAPFSARAPPSGPSADIRKVALAENPHVPRRVDYIVDDTDLRAVEGVSDLYTHGVAQSHITRVFSVGLLGMGKSRRLVPTEWSITAVDDILGKRILERVRDFPWIDEFRVFAHTALANTVAILLAPSAWMYEGLEAWGIESNPLPAHDHEFYGGREGYPPPLQGAPPPGKMPIPQDFGRGRRPAGGGPFLPGCKNRVPLRGLRGRDVC